MVQGVTTLVQDLLCGVISFAVCCRGDLPDSGIFFGIPCACWSMLCCLTRCTRAGHDMEQAGKEKHEPV